MTLYIHDNLWGPILHITFVGRSILIRVFYFWCGTLKLVGSFPVWTIRAHLHWIKWKALRAKTQEERQMKIVSFLYQLSLFFMLTLVRESLPFFLFCVFCFYLFIYFFVIMVAKDLVAKIFPVIKWRCQKINSKKKIHVVQLKFIRKYCFFIWKGHETYTAKLILKIDNVLECESFQ